MSSTSVPLKVVHSFQNVRLLELPDDLLSIITSSDQSRQPLILKSSPSIGDSASQGNLHLCSDEKAWLVKQVSTSNSVYVTKSKDSSSHGITAFAKPTSILELHPVKPADYQSVVRESLKRLLPTIAYAAQNVEESQYSREQLYDAIPAPRTTITQVLGQTCVSELPWSIHALGTERNPAESQRGKTFLPSPSLLLQTWRSILEAAIISETKITVDLEADVLLDTFAEKEEAVSESHNILKAVARVMFARHGYFELLGIIVRTTVSGMEDGINDMDLARWVGNIILKVAEAGSGPSIEKKLFETQWENAVPAYLGKYCSVEVLGHSCTLQKEGEMETVRWQEFKVASKDFAPIDTPSKATAPASRGKRKWHDKFAAMRTAKR